MTALSPSDIETLYQLPIGSTCILSTGQKIKAHHCIYEDVNPNKFCGVCAFETPTSLCTSVPCEADDRYDARDIYYEEIK